VAEQEAGVDVGGEWPVVVPYFIKEILEQVTIAARKSKFIDQQSGVSARFSIANYETVVASARQRAVRLGERPPCPGSATWAISMPRASASWSST